MNIFALDYDPAIAASYLVDSHVVKMPLETAQLLSTAVYILSGNKQYYRFYKPTHKNHPCSIWTRQSLANFNWLVEHGFAICDEYTRRFHKQHKSCAVIAHAADWIVANHSELPVFCAVPFTPFAQAMPEEFRCADPVEERHLHKWRAPATKPDWII
jgi:Pyrimidine dimer DNA glycosylase